MKELVLNLGSLLWHLCFNHVDTPFVCICCLSETRHSGIIFELLQRDRVPYKVTTYPLSSVITIYGVSGLPYRISFQRCMGSSLKENTVAPWCPLGIGSRTHHRYQNPRMPKFHSPVLLIHDSTSRIQPTTDSIYLLKNIHM